jgi:hypothetical protein
MISAPKIATVRKGAELEQVERRGDQLQQNERDHQAADLAKPAEGIDAVAQGRESGQ